jgi:hypothetical protein
MILLLDENDKETACRLRHETVKPHDSKEDASGGQRDAVDF